MRLRNNIFAAALDELKRRQIVKTQKELAQKMGVSEDTVTRILKDRTEVTEDAISKLQTASGCIFNLQWLRGEDPYHMLISDLLDDPDFGKSADEPHESAPIDADFYRQQLLARDAHIADIMHQLDNMNALVLDYGSKITELNELIADLREQNGSLNAHIEHYKRMVGEEKDRVEEYKNHLDDVRISNVGLQNQIDQQKVRISQLEAELKARRENPLYDYPHPLGVADERDK